MNTTDSGHGKKLVLVELNEINFDIVEKYIETKELPALKRLLAGSRIGTVAESAYADLEPWIQWPSVHTGLSAHEHGVFRLGDIVDASAPQIFEQLEHEGLSVGCLSAMNADNRLNSPAYFIPDPWTRTRTDGSWWSDALASAVSQAVNDNAQGRISAKSAVHLALGLVRFARWRNLGLYWKLAAHSRGAPWRKALLLDLFLHDLHMHLLKSSKPNFSAVLFNAGAHIQHHYLFNAAPVRAVSRLSNPTWYVSPDEDPVGEMLSVYDSIVAEYMAMSDAEVIVATGLAQRPYDRVKFYYRLRDHRAFLDSIGIEFTDVAPRMTRDFLVDFASPQDASVAQQKLASLRVKGGDVPLFGDIDNRGSSLFVTLTYPSEIDASTCFQLNGKEHPLAPSVVFVAIKNGMHQSEGFAFFTPGVAAYAPDNKTHVKELYSTIKRFFGLDSKALRAG